MEIYSTMLIFTMEYIFQCNNNILLYIFLINNIEFFNLFSFII